MNRKEDFLPLNLRRRTLLGAGLLAATTPLAAQLLPSGRTTSVLSTGSPGSSMDYVARKLSAHFTQHLGGAYAVENLQGAGGSLAANQLLKRPADGETLLVAHSGLLCSFPLLHKDKLAFHPTEDLVPVAIPTGTPMFVVSGTRSGWRDLAQLREARGQAMAYAAGSIGSTGHIGGTLFFEAMGIPATPAFYTKNSQAVLDIAEGVVRLGLFSWQAVAPLVAAGRLTVLCTLSPRRLPFAPGVRTAQEQGVDVGVEGWVGLFVRQGTPEDVIARHAAAVDELMAGSTTQTFLDTGGLSRVNVRRHEAPAFIGEEIRRHAALIERHGIRIG